MKHLSIYIGLFVTVTLFGCGGDTKKPSDTDDLIFAEKIIGDWNVVSVNDIAPSRFLTVLMVEELNEEYTEVPNKDVPVQEDRQQVARDGDTVGIAADEQIVYQVKVVIEDFHYSFSAEDLWVLHVQFDILPNDDATPLDGDAAADPVQRAAPAANSTSEAIGVVVSRWVGTYQVVGDMLTLMIESEDVQITPLDPDIEDDAEADTEGDAQAELTRKFRSGLITPYSKTYMSIDDAGRLTLRMPGTSRGKMALEKR